MKTFVGRHREISQLTDLTRKSTASLITIQGRRRIGKSTLVRHFCTLQKMPCFEFQGLPPRALATNQGQLDEFARTLAKHLGVRELHFSNWTEVFEHLDLLCAKHLRDKKKFVIFLDEISWMGGRDTDFPGYLKDVWDRRLSQNPNLILVLCGSVSSWIQKNILDSTGFVGRVSREFLLKELSIAESTSLLRSALPSLTCQEVAQILSITGGIPKYLEEFSPYKTVETAVLRLILQPSGFLFNELETIFSESFAKRDTLYREVLKILIKKPLTPHQLAEQIGHPLNGDWTAHLSNLELAGFLRRDYSWDFRGEASKTSILRVADNFARFYLKYVEPKKSRLTKLPINSDSISSLLNWNSTFGLQFEGLMLNNLESLVRVAQIPGGEILQVGPYYQSPTKAKEGVQIDCLVQCKKGILHAFEFKTGQQIGMAAEQDARRKTTALKTPRGFAIRNYLVYLGTLSEELAASDFFDRLIPFEEFIFTDTREP
jgi:hypothetical protein